MHNGLLKMPFPGGFSRLVLWLLLILTVVASPLDTSHTSFDLSTRGVFDSNHPSLLAQDALRKRTASILSRSTQQSDTVHELLESLRRRAPSPALQGPFAIPKKAAPAGKNPGAAPKAPAKGAPKNSPTKGKVPEVKDIEKQLQFGKNDALFWSGDREAAAKYAKAKGLKTMDMAITGETPWNTKWLQEPKIRDEYWDRASTAMVNKVSGIVYVMLRGGANDPIAHPGTVWTRMEWPPIKAGKNPKIQKVIRVNPKGETVGQIWPPLRTSRLKI